MGHTQVTTDQLNIYFNFKNIIFDLLRFQKG